jgi:hypothetical protein
MHVKLYGFHTRALSCVFHAQGYVRLVARMNYGWLDVQIAQFKSRVAQPVAKRIKRSPPTATNISTG